MPVGFARRHAAGLHGNRPETGHDVMQVDWTAPIGHAARADAVHRAQREVSPDGRWLAYEANDSGRFEIYVRPFPDVTGGRWQVSTGGGTRPLWARNGQELFYLAPAGALMRVGVERGPSWAATAPTQLLKDGYCHRAGESRPDLRHLPRRPAVSADQAAAARTRPPRPRASSSSSTSTRS